MSDTFAFVRNKELFEILRTVEHSGDDPELRQWALDRLRKALTDAERAYVFNAEAMSPEVQVSTWSPRIVSALLDKSSGLMTRAITSGRKLTPRWDAAAGAPAPLACPACTVVWRPEHLEDVAQLYTYSHGAIVHINLTEWEGPADYGITIYDDNCFPCPITEYLANCPVCLHTVEIDLTELKRNSNNAGLYP